MNIKPIYNNKLFKRGLEFAADNSALFVATTSLCLSTVARPIAIMSAPKTDKENRHYAASKSIASSLVGYLLMLSASVPLANAIKKIDNNPDKFLKSKTIETLKNGEKALNKSSKYKFATQLFKLGLGFVLAVPKSIMTCALIPNIMGFWNNKQKNDIKAKNTDISFKGLEKQAAKIIDTSFVQKMANRFHKTNYEQHIISMTDILATGAFITQTNKSCKIKEDRKKALIYNAGISTGLSVAGGYIINDMTKKSTNRFIRKFRRANIDSPKLNKYIEGIRIAKPAMILGCLYYIVIPLISTCLSDRIDKTQKNYLSFRANDKPAGKFKTTFS